MPEFAPIEVPQGPLIQAHVPNITGAEWPKLENVGAGIVAAAAKGAEINGKTRALENRLLTMQLAEQNKDIEHGLAVTRLAQNAYFREKQLTDDATMDKARMADMVFKQNWKTDTTNDYADLVQELHQAGVKPGDPNYWSTVLDIESRHSKSAMTPAGRQLHNMHGIDFNKAAANEANAAYAEDRAIKSDIKALDWHGLNPTTAIFDSQAAWIDKDQQGNPILWKDKDGNPIIDPVTKKPVPAKAIYLGPDQMKQPQWLTLPNERYQQYQDRWNHAQSRLSRLQEQISDPYGSIPKFPVDTTGGSGPQPLPPRDKLVKNVPYQVPGMQGSYTWDGTNLIPVR